MEGSSLEAEMESFQQHVTDRFLELSSVAPDDLLSVSWVGKLLDCFLCCQEEFRAIVRAQKTQVLRPPLDRMVSDYFDRSVKALDGNQRSIGEGQFRRARKALADLAIGMLDDKDSSASIANRNRSFGRNTGGKDHHHSHSHGHFRSLSWSVSRTWSAAKQLQAIGNSINPPKANDLVASNGIAMTLFIMNSILLFVMWALVAAIPCQDRGLHVHFTIPRNFSLLREIHQIEKCARSMNELSDSVYFPLTEDKEREVRQIVQEVSQVCDALKDGLDPLERQVRQVFHKIVRSRTEGIDSLGRPTYAE
ncbi:hypothetical protein V8G54_028687 [Vigna mungo]|uniref:Uncharacterized protein n=1 Tax=Vigna mungo TaxID=3915 RepID=A0AAQ3RJL6_VIGMU